MNPHLAWQAVWKEVAHLGFAWSVLKDISAPEHVPILNRAAKPAFSVIQRALIADVIACASRLTDREKSRNHETLGLLGLLRELNDQLPGERRSEVLAAVEELKSSMKPIRTYRDKVLAHLDRDVALGLIEIPKVTWDHIEQAVDRIRSIMISIERQIRDGETIWDRSIMLGDAKSIVSLLERALSLKSEWIEWQKKNQSDPVVHAVTKVLRSLWRDSSAVDRS